MFSRDGDGDGWLVLAVLISFSSFHSRNSSHNIAARNKHHIYCWMWFQWKVLRNLWFYHSPEECEALLMRLLLLLMLFAVAAAAATIAVDASMGDEYISASINNTIFFCDNGLFWYVGVQKSLHINMCMRECVCISVVYFSAIIAKRVSNKGWKESPMGGRREKVWEKPTHEHQSNAHTPDV